MASAEPKKATKTTRRKAPVCRKCRKKTRVPSGWTIGPAVRKHYWRHHRDHMTRATAAGGSR